MSAASTPARYHGVDPHTPNLAGQIESTVQAHLPANGAKHHIHALIDGAVDPAFGLELLKASRADGAQVCSLYAGTPLEAADECAPFLWHIARQQLPELLARCNGRPMLSFIQTPFGLEEFQRHLSGFTRARMDDGMTLVLRLGDPLAFRDIVAALGAPFADALRPGFAAWHVIGRDGSAYSWAGTATPDDAPLEPRTEPWPMSDAAYGQLVDSGEVEGLMGSVMEMKPRLVAQYSATALHGRVVVLLAALNAAGLHDEPRRSGLVARALDHPDELASVMWLKEQVRRTV